MAIFKQTGLSITKEGNVLTMTWKLADFYDSQEAYWSIEGNTVLTELDGDETSVSYTIPVQNFFPNTMLMNVLVMILMSNHHERCSR